MKAFYKYIGDPEYPGSGPGATDLFGVHFPLNEAVEVDAPKAVHDKLEGNSHFEKVDGRKATARKATAKDEAPAD